MSTHDVKSAHRCLVSVVCTNKNSMEAVTQFSQVSFHVGTRVPQLDRNSIKSCLTISHCQRAIQQACYNCRTLAAITFRKSCLGFFSPVFFKFYESHDIKQNGISVINLRSSTVSTRTLETNENSLKQNLFQLRTSIPSQVIFITLKCSNKQGFRKIRRGFYSYLV